MDPVKQETNRYLMGDVDNRTRPAPPRLPQPKPTNLVDATFTKERGLEIILYDAESTPHRSPITPAAAANLIRRLAGYLATHHEAAL
jgi:hypothetical protein